MMEATRRPATGGCLCGAVRFEVNGPLRNVLICHCTLCRRTHGHVAAYTAAKREDVTMVSDRGLAWYRSSDRARRGFCRDCGSRLFWSADARPTISIAAGALDESTGLETIGHIFTASKGDYYRIEDGAMQYPHRFPSTAE